MKRWVALAALAVIASACGSSGGTALGSPSSPLAASPSPLPSPSGLVFKLGGINTAATGTIHVVAHPPSGSTPGSISLELVITGLQANSVHVSHIHNGNCKQRGSIALALNQVVADGQGNADTKSTVAGIYPPLSGTWYVVVHAGPDMQGSNASYLLCGNLFA